MFWLAQQRKLMYFEAQTDIPLLSQYDTFKGWVGPSKASKPFANWVLDFQGANTRQKNNKGKHRESLDNTISRCSLLLDFDMRTYSTETFITPFVTKDSRHKKFRSAALRLYPKSWEGCTERLFPKIGILSSLAYRAWYRWSKCQPR